jgi:hypothetical protein
MRPLFYLVLLHLIFVQCSKGAKEYNYETIFPGKPAVPASIMREHKMLLSQIAELSLWKDSTGVIAGKIREIMEHHFKEEEDFVLPVLGILPSLAAGNMPDHAEKLIGLTQKIKEQLPHLSAEHQMIRAHLDELRLAAERDGHTGITEFLEAIHEHAGIEEEILFPAAIVIGDFLQLRMEKI